METPSLRERILQAETKEELRTLADEALSYKDAAPKTLRRIQRAIIKRTAEIKAELKKAA